MKTDGFLRPDAPARLKRASSERALTGAAVDRARVDYIIINTPL